MSNRLVYLPGDLVYLPTCGPKVFLPERSVVGYVVPENHGIKA